jgi:hypothetical protein
MSGALTELVLFSDLPIPLDVTPELWTWHLRIRRLVNSTVGQLALVRLSPANGRLNAKRKSARGKLPSGAYAANRLSFSSASGVVANRARPLAQPRRPVICSAIVFDSGTNSVKTRAMARSVGSLLSSKA